MVHYKLTYFNGRGLAEVTRQLFALADQKYEDVRHTDQTFAPVKSTFPFGQLPVLEVDGQVLAQSHAIARYVARTFGFAGKDAFEQAVIDSLADQYKDYMKEIWPYIQAAYGFGPANLLDDNSIELRVQAKLKDEVLLPGRAKFLGFITNFLKKNSAHGKATLEDQDLCPQKVLRIAMLERLLNLYAARFPLS
ncbi:unnamed protein product [Heligmosomoides polygyrus]|uniref:glutathione transferase n=1 Tax=Heligmosomoides polygyrus TaxID=6339 RepID=A0A183GPP6_HELPZ|nr:unnamed protein product [Heligmosomoides polygyrus]